MMGPTHRLFGAACGVSVAAATGQSEAMILMSGLVASATSHGWSSPDVDQSGPWVALRRALPPALARLMNHRTGVSHWWAVPVVLWLLAETLAPLEALWPARALLVGWSSHLVGDALFGRIPLWPRGPMIGLGLPTDGFLESGRVWGYRILPISPVQVAILGWLAWMAYPVWGSPTSLQGTDVLQTLLPTLMS